MLHANLTKVLCSWATRYPTNVSDVGRVLGQIAELSTENKEMPSKLHFSSQKLYTKYAHSFCTLGFAEHLLTPIFP